MTRKEISQAALRKCFNAEEVLFLSKDGTFKMLFDAAATLDDVEAVAKLGSKLLLEAEFPDDGRTRLGT